MQSIRTVLVVDDAEIVRNTAGAILKAHGYRVLPAENGAAAIALMRENADEICLAVLDAGMMPLPAGSVAASLTALSPKLAIVVSSGAPPEEALRHFGPGRVSGFLQKPYTATRLRESVGLALQTSRWAE